MKQKFTPEDLVSYLYHETSASQRLAIEEAIQSDPVLAEEVNAMRRAKRQMPKVKFNASDRVLGRVLRYSQHRELETQA